MRTDRVVESRRDRRELAHEAGFPRVSLGSVLAGVLVAYGAFAILAAIGGGILNAMGYDTTELSTNDWRELGIGSGIAVAFSLFLSYLFGGYVAGRMARRSGAMNGFFVFVLGILVAAGVGAAIGLQADGDVLMSNLRSIGVPTSSEEWMSVGTIAGLCALAAMLVGSIFGGISGERWHGKLVARALDPAIGPEVDLRGPDAESRNSEVVHDGAHFRADDASSDADPDSRLDVTHSDTSLDRSNTTLDRSNTTLDEDLARTRTAH